MLRLIRFLWTGSWHEHEWEVYAKGSITSDGGKIGNYYDLRCKTCGWMRERRL